MAVTIDCLKPIFKKYDYKYSYSHKAQEACHTCLSKKNPFNLLPNEYKGQSEKESSTKFIDWKGKSRGLFFHYPTDNPNVFCLKLSDDCKGPPPPVECRERTKTRCTQTRYRESSAQTRSYQPEVGGNKENYKNFEVYEISELLDTIDPPGEYEAKLVERYRRRRKYEKALQLTQNDPEKHRTVLEAMEWDEWVAREEDIHGCQMLRMEIVARMIEEREKKFREASEQRILCSAEEIYKKRDRQMKKISVEYSRGIRRLELEKLKLTRSYRKGNITQEHIDRASDLYAPQMRFGVNPNRRHFVGFRKNFDDRINDLDKQKDERGMASLICPFSKLRNWAKPKEQMKEVSQMFCSDENLKNLYQSLKNLRTMSETTKLMPKCLKKKVKPPQRESDISNMPKFNKVVVKPKIEKEDTKIAVEDTHDSLPNETIVNNLHMRRLQDLASRNSAEISNIVAHFEGKILGKLMQFLSDELQRLKQQKKFQAVCMLAERERWRREAIEAGQRQKENKNREDQEKLFKAGSEIHRDTATMFLESVLEEEFKFTSELLATDKLEEMARDIDTQDVESIRLEGKEKRSYDRAVIGDYVQNQVFSVAAARERKMKADKLKQAQLEAIQEEFMADVKKALDDKYEVPHEATIVGELLDELIFDAVTYDFDLISPESTDDEFDPPKEINAVINKFVKMSVRHPGVTEIFTDSTDYEEYLTGVKEAKAIMNKMVRIAVPAERWKREVDRIVEQTVSETFNDAVYEVECLKASRYVRANDRLNDVINEIYNRIGCYKTTEPHSENETESSTESTEVKSISSKFNIFDSPTNQLSNDEYPDEEIGQIQYIDPTKLETFEPPEISRRHERFDIMKDVAKRYQCGDENAKFLNDSSEQNIETSSEEIVGYSSGYLKVFKSNITLPWLQGLHPELLIIDSNCDSDKCEEPSRKCDDAILDADVLIGSHRSEKGMSKENTSESSRRLD